MAHKHRTRPSPRLWLASLFRQPSPSFYHKPAIYLCGNLLEAEHFLSVLTYDRSLLRLRFAHGIFTVYGDDLRILSMTAGRITLCGRVLRTDFSDD